MVTQEQLDFYEEKGYLQIEGLLESEFLSELQNKSTKLIKTLQKEFQNRLKKLME